MGVMGAYVVLGTRRRLPVAPVVGLLVLNFFIGFTGGIDWRAHLGGLVTGALLALALRLRRQPAGPDHRTGASPSAAAWRSWACWRCSSSGVAPGHVNLS